MAKNLQDLFNNQTGTEIRYTFEGQSTRTLGNVYRRKDGNGFGLLLGVDMVEASRVITHLNVLALNVENRNGEKRYIPADSKELTELISTSFKGQYTTLEEMRSEHVLA